jgi:uncharacterized RDD family membrane protein YckC
MSLRSFHIVFVIVSALLCAFLAVWGLLLSGDTGMLSRTVGFTGVAGLLLLPVYGSYFLRKARKAGL